MYQPIIVENAQKIINILEESNFFIDHELDNTDYALSYLCEKLNKKYIENGLLTNEFKFSNEELTVFLKEIIAGTILESLESKGFVSSYEDENTEKIYFLTEEGKKFKDYMEHNDNNDNIKNQINDK